MRALVIDTNALISFVTDRNLDQQRRISTIFDDAAQLKVTILCPQNVLTEFVYVLEKIYRQSKSQIRSMIADFIDLCPGSKSSISRSKASFIGIGFTKSAADKNSRKKALLQAGADYVIEDIDVLEKVMGKNTSA